MQGGAFGRPAIIVYGSDLECQPAAGRLVDGPCQAPAENLDRHLGFDVVERANSDLYDKIVRVGVDEDVLNVCLSVALELDGLPDTSEVHAAAGRAGTVIVHPPRLSVGTLALPPVACRAGAPAHPHVV